MQDRRRVTSFRLTLWLSMTPAEEQAYRAEHALGDSDSTRRHLAARLQDQLDGEGEIAGWWHDARMH